MLPPTCAVCGIEMERGFLPDFAHGQIRNACWHRGEPTTKYLLLMENGVLYDSEAALHIIAYRCGTCGELRLWALDK